MRFSNIAVVCFQYLLKLGYEEISENENTVKYVKGNFVIDVWFERYCEVYVTFSLKTEEVRVTLQEVMDYFNIQERGFYQIASMDKMQLAIEYVSNITSEIVGKLKNNEKFVVMKIYEVNSKKRTKSLEDYYIQNDLQYAETYWKTKEYEKVRKLYVKNLEHLSEVQKKRLEYIQKSEILGNRR